MEQGFSAVAEANIQLASTVATTQFPADPAARYAYELGILRAKFRDFARMVDASWKVPA